jgi:acyl-CoA thioester hydrolase
LTDPKPVTTIFSLSHPTEVTVRFNEADPVGIVWHGHYIRYFEDGRESFGKKFGMSYLDFYHAGLAVPIVSVQCDFKQPLRYGDTVIVESTWQNDAAAKIRFEYKIYKPDTGAIVARGSSIQVFVDLKSFQLHLTIPPFFEKWKKKWALT